MSTINVLPKEVAELIAAGEVIERPASVIKELVENCIDAGARTITVEIQNGGTTYLRVTDDGCGIEPEDVKNAFLRHATSKINVSADLDAIATLGFRGEALASICAVSKVEVLTKCRERVNGIRYCIQGGEEKECDPIGCPDGTTFIVRDLFYNVPARMKFLKKNVSEGNAVGVLMDRIALSHPEISFTLIRDGKRVMKTGGNGKLADAVYQVFGKEFYAALLPVDYQFNEITVQGYVTKPIQSVKANRSLQVFFINGRYVRSKTAMAALEQAYSGSIMTGRYPSCVLMLTMNCSMLDVNVHPAKLEVRFTNERPVYEAVYHAVRSAVMNYDTRDDSASREEIRYTAPSLLAPPGDEGVQLGFVYGRTAAPVNPTAQAFVGAGGKNKIAGAWQKQSYPTVAERDIKTVGSPIAAPVGFDPPIVQPRTEQSFPEVEAPPEQPEQPPTVTAAPAFVDVLTQPEQPDSISAELEEPPVASVSSGEVTVADEDHRDIPFRYIGQAFSTYIILEYDNDRLMFIDKHAAHERLLYEKLKHQQRGSFSQLLLEPVSVTLEKDEFQTVMEHQEMLMDAGFEIDAFGERTVLIRSAPVMLQELNIAEEFSEIAAYLCRHKKLILSEKMEWIYANTACRAAIKAGNVSHAEELIDLAMTLEQNPEIRYCPHGRPIYFFMTRSEIERNFKRIT